MNALDLANMGAAVVVSLGLNSLWLGLLIAAIAAGMLRVLPRSNAATRYLVWFAALVLVCAAPAMLLIPRTEAPSSVAAAVPAATPLVVPTTAGWPLYIMLAWMGTSAILLARVAWSLAHIHGLKRRGTPVGRRDNIRVLASTEVRVPMAAGFVHRAIIFPKALIGELTSEEFDQVLCHELAHLHRGDDWTQLIQAIGEAVLFFNPAIHWIGRRLRIEREMACDDWVVSTTGEARPYAACLTHLHELTRRASAPQLAPGATTRKRWQISARIESLLQPGRNSTPRLARSGWVAAVALVSAGLIVAAKTTPPVGVQQIPVAPMTFARLNVPAAPVIALAPRRSSLDRPRMLAGRIPLNQMAKAAPPAAPVTDVPYLLVNAWRVEVSPTYYVITVVFFEPPPAHPLNGI